MKNLVGETCNIGTLFSSDFFFKVPDYQRPFSWGDDQFEELIADIISADKTQEYFLGTIVLHKGEAANHYNIVDGQQRITTLLILEAVLRDIVGSSEIKDNLHDKILQKRNQVDNIPEKPRIEVKDREIFNQMVITRDGTNKDFPKDLPEPESRYAKAASIFKTELAKFKPAELVTIVQFLNQKCVVVYLSTETFDDAFRLFTIINDRGLQLRRIDILKSINLSPSVLTGETIRARISQQWEEYEKELGEEVFENIFHFIRLMYVKEKPKGDLISEFDKFIFKPGLIGKGEAFTDVCFELIRLYKTIFIDKDISLEPETEANKFKMLLHIMDTEFKASEWRACILKFAQKFQYGKLFEFVCMIEKVYVTQWVQGIRKDERYNVYTKILKDIDSNTDASTVIKNTSSSMDRSVIEGGIRNKSLYGSQYCKYVLLKLELAHVEFNAFKEFSVKSIEHVLPQTPAAGTDWLTWVTPAEAKDYCHQVGNLVLLSKSKNSSAKNFSFSDKKKKYLQPRVSDFPRSVSILTETTWTKDVIERLNTKAVTDFFTL